MDTAVPYIVANICALFFVGFVATKRKSSIQSHEISHHHHSSDVTGAQHNHDSDQDTIVTTSNSVGHIDENKRQPSLFEKVTEDPFNNKPYSGQFTRATDDIKIDNERKQKENIAKAEAASKERAFVASKRLADELSAKAASDSETLEKLKLEETKAQKLMLSAKESFVEAESRVLIATQEMKAADVLITTATKNLQDTESNSGIEDTELIQLKGLLNKAIEEAQKAPVEDLSLAEAAKKAFDFRNQLENEYNDAFDVTTAAHIAHQNDETNDKLKLDLSVKTGISDNLFEMYDQAYNEFNKFRSKGQCPKSCDVLIGQQEVSKQIKSFQADKAAKISSLTSVRQSLEASLLEKTEGLTKISAARDTLNSLLKQAEADAKSASLEVTRASELAFKSKADAEKARRNVDTTTTPQTASSLRPFGVNGEIIKVYKNTSKYPECDQYHVTSCLMDFGNEQLGGTLLDEHLADNSGKNIFKQITDFGALIKGSSRTQITAVQELFVFDVLRLLSLFMLNELYKNDVGIYQTMLSDILKNMYKKRYKQELDIKQRVNERLLIEKMIQTIASLRAADRDLESGGGVDQVKKKQQQLKNIQNIANEIKLSNTSMASMISNEDTLQDAYRVLIGLPEKDFLNNVEILLDLMHTYLKKLTHTSNIFYISTTTLSFYDDSKFITSSNNDDSYYNSIATSMVKEIENSSKVWDRQDDQCSKEEWIDPLQNPTKERVTRTVKNMLMFGLKDNPSADSVVNSLSRLLDESKQEACIIQSHDLDFTKISTSQLVRCCCAQYVENQIYCIKNNDN